VTQDKFLVVRDIRTNKPVSIPTSSIPLEIRPDNWYENPHWRYNPMKRILEPLINALYSNIPLAAHEIQYLAQYITDYACHIAVGVHLFGGKDTTAFNVECIKKLRILKEGASTKDDIREMIRVGMDYAMDPF